MDAEANNPSTGLDMDSAIARLMGTQPSEDKAPKGTPKSEEVTESEETVKTEEAAELSTRKPRVDPDEQAAAEALSEEETEAEDEPDGDEDADEDSEEEVEEQDSEDEDSDEEADDDEPETVFSLDDGTEVDLDELKRGYLRQSDYTKKTQEVAESRKQVEQAYQQFDQSQSVLAENLNLALSVVEPQLAELAGTDWDALARDDAYSYAEKRAQFDQAQARYNKLMESAQAVVQQQQAKQRQAMQQRLQQEAQKLQMAIPDFADPSKAKTLKNQLTEYATSKIGLSENEARGISDHRMLILLQKAMKFDELSDGELSVARKKVSKAPRKSLKPGKPTSKGEKATQARNQQMSKLKRSGKEADAVDLLMSRLS